MIKFLCNTELEGMEVMAEPSPERWTILTGGKDRQLLQGQNVSVLDTLPLNNITSFGVNFLDRLRGSIANCEMLDNLTFVDTPGLGINKSDEIDLQYD